MHGTRSSRLEEPVPTATPCGPQYIWRANAAPITRLFEGVLIRFGSCEACTRFPSLPTVELGSAFTATRTSAARPVIPLAPLTLSLEVEARVAILREPLLFLEHLETCVLKGWV